MSVVVRCPKLLCRGRSHVLVIDVQEKLVPVIDGAERILNEINLLLDAASVLDVPVSVSEQYPKGLGATVSSIARHSAVRRTFEKLRFSAADEFVGLVASSFDERASLPAQVILVGIESHICVLQTALDLKQFGWDVSVVVNAVGSRKNQDHESALARMANAGISLVTTESVVFEWCEIAGTDQFRQISRLVRSHAE